MSGSPTTKTPTPTTSAGYTVKTTDDASSQLEYFGEAPPGSATSDAVWRIKKLTYTSGGNPSWTYADNTDRFIKVWDSRATYTY